MPLTPPATISRASMLPLHYQLSEYIRQQIHAGEWRPGDRIPTNRIDPVAANAQQYYGPRPNSAGLPFTGQNNFFFQGKSKSDVNRGTTKVDHQLNDKQRMFARYTIFNNDSAQPVVWDSPGCPDGAASLSSRTLVLI